MPSPSSRARGTLARDTKPELSLSPTEETEWMGPSPRRRPDPQSPGWEDAPRAARPRHPRVTRRSPAVPSVALTQPGTLIPPGTGPASPPSFPSPAAAVARTRRRLRGCSSQPGFPSLTSFPVWA